MGVYIMLVSDHYNWLWYMLVSEIIKMGVKLCCQVRQLQWNMIYVGMSDYQIVIMKCVCKSHDYDILLNSY